MVTNLPNVRLSSYIFYSPNILIFSKRFGHHLISAPLFHIMCFLIEPFKRLNILIKTVQLLRGGPACLYRYLEISAAIEVKKGQVWLELISSTCGHIYSGDHVQLWVRISNWCVEKPQKSQLCRTSDMNFYTLPHSCPGFYILIV